jgi:hypothetical protein
MVEIRRSEQERVDEINSLNGSFRHGRVDVYLTGQKEPTVTNGEVDNVVRIDGRKFIVFLENGSYEGDRWLVPASEIRLIRVHPRKQKAEARR